MQREGGEGKSVLILLFAEACVYPLRAIADGFDYRPLEHTIVLFGHLAHSVVVVEKPLQQGVKILELLKLAFLPHEIEVYQVTELCLFPSAFNGLVDDLLDSFHFLLGHFFPLKNNSLLDL